VFLKPTIVRSGAATTSVTADRYDYILGEQQRLKPQERPLWPQPEVPLLPPRPLPESGTGTQVAPPVKTP
jgi:general secretion pathway protein D